MFCIRPARLEDAGHLPEIERSAGQSFLHIPALAWIASDEVQSIERHRELIEIGSAWIAETPSGEIVGFLNGETIGQTFHVWEVSVRQQAQGQGLGRALMQAAMAQARLDGLKAVTLTTFRQVGWNEPFYHSLGFRTLAIHELSARLAEILETEVLGGLPREARCAMALGLV